MGYLIKKLPYVKRSWKVQHETWTPARKIKDIPLTSYQQHGFLPSMTYDEAVAKKDQLNALLDEKRHQAARVRIQERKEDEDRALLAFLNELDVREFETQVLYGRDDMDVIHKSKVESHWRAAKRMLCALKIEPHDWAARKLKFYDYFSKETWSPSYVQKVLRITNQWGDFLAYKYKSYFKPIPAPTGREKERIADKFFDKLPHGRKSDVLYPDQLESKRSELPEAAFNWLWLSVWLGLRPDEVTQVARGQNVELKTINGVKCVRVYQTKLMSVPRPERWKTIPCYEPEQLVAFGLLSSSAPTEIPGRKLRQNHFGERMGLYGGRKGFMDLMLGRKHALEDISTWMGHTTIDRTWRDYKNRLHVNIRMPVKV